MPETTDPWTMPALYPSPAPAWTPGTPVPPTVTPPAEPAPVRAGGAFRPARLLPALASAAPMAAGRLWYLHGGHGLAAIGVGGLSTVGFAMAFATRSDPDTAAWTAALSAFVLDFAVCAYATEWYLPGGLFALTLTAAYTAAHRAWHRDERRERKAAERREHDRLTAATTVQVQQIKAQRDVTVAAINAHAAVKVAETHATAHALAAVPYPLLELDPAAKAMLTLDPRVKAMLERRPPRELEASPSQGQQDAADQRGERT